VTPQSVKVFISEVTRPGKHQFLTCVPDCRPIRNSSQSRLVSTLYEGRGLRRRFRLGPLVSSSFSPWPFPISRRAFLSTSSDEPSSRFRLGFLSYWTFCCFSEGFGLTVFRNEIAIPWPRRNKYCSSTHKQEWFRSYIVLQSPPQLHHQLRMIGQFCSHNGR
jgi:hypothetical protein